MTSLTWSGLSKLFFAQLLQFGRHPYQRTNVMPVPGSSCVRSMPPLLVTH